MILALFGLVSAQAATAYGTFSPSCTDNGITTDVQRQCTSATHSADSHVWVPNSAPANLEERLVVLLPGTKNEPEDHDEIARIIADAGFRVIVLSYDSNQEHAGSTSGSLGAFCEHELPTDADCEGDVAQRVLFGSASGVSVFNHELDDQDSVHARLVDVLTQLDSANPTHGWDDYLTQIDVADPTTDAVWCDFIFAGFSQGTNYAAQLASLSDVGGVVLLEGPGTEGNWLTATHATDPSLWFGANHAASNDRTAQWDDLGMPSGESEVWQTTAGPWPLDPADNRLKVYTKGHPCTAHKSMAVDGCLAIVPTTGLPFLTDAYTDIFTDVAAEVDPECAP
jgi:hypothetical protein